MDILTKDDLKTLIERQDEASVSLFMPTHRMGQETRQDPIRFKNLLGEAEAQLTANGLQAPKARKLLEPARALLDDQDFWQHQSEGLALFISTDLFRYYRLPSNFEELVVVADWFHLKPLLPVLSGDSQFYILALSKNQVRLLSGTRYRVEELDLEGVPQSLAEALQYDEFQKQQQFHTKTAPGADGRAAIFHGQGGPESDENKNILRYFRQIDRGLKELLQNEHVPVVLAGVEYLFPIYHEANTYPHLSDSGIAGNPDEMSAKLLHERAWAIVEPQFQQAQQKALQRFNQLIDTDQTSTDIREIVPAAHYGRVDTLFVAVTDHRWGAFEPETNTISLHQDAKVGDKDLLDSAAVQTLLYGGAVYAMEPEKVPAGAPLAAVLRFA